MTIDLSTEMEPGVLLKIDEAASNMSFVKDGKNSVYNSKFVSIDQVMADVRKAFGKVGLVLTQLILGDDGNGKIAIRTIVVDKHTGGKVDFVTRFSMPEGSTMDEINSATTVVRRQVLRALVMAPAVDDDGVEAQKAFAAMEETKTEPANPSVIQQLQKAFGNDNFQKVFGENNSSVAEKPQTTVKMPARGALAGLR